MSPWRRIRGMPVTEESAHADVPVLLPSMSTMAFRSSKAEAEIKIISKISIH